MLSIKEIKLDIESNNTLPNILIFKVGKSDSSEFLFHQYINEYSKNKNLDIIFVDSITELTSTGLFICNSNNLYVYETTKLDVSLVNITSNVWVKCSSIPKKVEEEYSDIIIEIPKLEEWQIKDYIFSNTGNLLEQNANKLYSNYKGNLFRLELELEKLKLFDNKQEIYDQIESQLYVDSTEYSIFDLTNCILRRDINKLLQLKNELSIIDVDPFGLIKILINNFRYVIDIQLAKNATPDYVGISSKQFWAIKNYSCGFYTKDELVYIYKFLLSLDDKIKSGEIPIELIINYIICKILLL